jgi:hypothetical protein
MNAWIRSAGWLLLASGLAVAFTSRAQAQDTYVIKGGWVSLFDGTTLSGWTVNPLSGPDASKWEVKDGVIVGTGKPSMLVSPKSYKNFRFRAEIKINDHGNSGMYVRTKPKPGFTDGYEIQVNSTHSDPIKTGSVYTIVHVYKQLVPPDTWFTQEIRVVDKNWRGKLLPHIQVTVNGDTLYELIERTAEFKEGHFAFQQHDPGSVVQIRKIEVMELPDTK